MFKTTSSTSRKRNLMVFLRPTIIRDGILANSISQRKYNFIRAEQLKRQSEGVALLPNLETPVLPKWDDSLALPPSYDEFLLEKSEQELGIKKQEDDE